MTMFRTADRPAQSPLRARAAEWRELAALVHGRYREEGPHRRPQLELHYAGWTLVFDDHAWSVDHGVVWCTRARAPYVAQDGLSAVMRSRTLRDTLLSLLRRRRVRTGDRVFDARYEVDGNDPARLRALCADRRLRDALLAADLRELSLRHLPEETDAHPPEVVDELCLEADGLVHHAARLAAMAEAAERFLSRLAKLGCCSEREPQPSAPAPGVVTGA